MEIKPSELMIFFQEKKKIFGDINIIELFPSY